MYQSQTSSTVSCMPKTRRRGISLTHKSQTIENSIIFNHSLATLSTSSQPIHINRRHQMELNEISDREDLKRKNWQKREQICKLKLQLENISELQKELQFKKWQKQYQGMQKQEKENLKKCYYKYKKYNTTIQELQNRLLHLRNKKLVYLRNEFSQHIS